MTTVPQSAPGRRLRRPPVAILVAVVLLLALAATLAARALTSAPADPLAGATLAPVARGDLTLGVTATGAVEPRVQAELSFAPGAGGRVRELLVAPGDAVRAGEPLIILDDRQLAAELAAAEANLAVADADLQAIRDGATPEQLAEAAAQVRAARGALTQAQGSVTQADLAAARAGVAEAQARLAAVEAGPKRDTRTRAATALDDARAELERQRSALAAAKERARVEVEQRANAVREAQSAYSSAYWDLEHVRAYGTDPRSGLGLNDTQKQDFQAGFDAAARRLADAEAGLAQSQVDYETARQNEVSGLQSAEARVRSAEADLDTLQAGADADELAAAQAQLARARAQLAALSSGAQSGAVAAQAGNLAAAQARLDQLAADPKASDIARAQARVEQARAQVEQVKVRIEDATLRAPFAGVVASVDVAPGEVVGGAAPPVVLIDVSRFLAKITVDEVDIGRVAVGQRVRVLVDALGEPALAGTVRRVEPLPQGESAVTAYRVTVEIDPGDRELKPGMTASATIVADERADVLYVLAAAVRRDGERSLVQVAVTGADGARSAEEREVEVGLRAGDQIEIVRGLAEGEQVIIP